MNDDMSRPTATNDDTQHTLTIREVADRYEAAGHPKSIRTLQRYCKSNHLDNIPAPTALGDMYLITPQSVARHIAQLEEIRATTHVAVHRDQPRPTATADVETNKTAQDAATLATHDDMSRPTATVKDNDDRYVKLLESENEFLRGQIVTKDTQIGELTERSRETNMLVGGLQRLLAPLLGSPESRRRTEGLHDMDAPA